jgi:hypothetical protein
MYSINYQLKHQHWLQDEMFTVKVKSLFLAQQLWDELDKTFRMLSRRPTNQE